MAMFVTGNLNLFDQRSSKEYGYESVRDHYDDFLEQWYEDVKSDDDHIYILGNLSQYAPQVALDAIESLPGTKHLMAGPRDLISPEVKKGWMESQRYAEVFTHTSTSTRRRLHGYDAILSHHGPESDCWWAPRKTEAFYITAHKDIPEDNTNGLITIPWVPDGDGLELSVSWNSWSRLVNWEEVKDIFSGHRP